MKTICFLIIISQTLLGCSQSSASSDNKTLLQSEYSNISAVSKKANQILDSVSPENLFTLIEAEKILGEPAHLSDSATTFKDDITIFSCAFTANAIDPKSTKTGVIYFLIKQFAKDSSAKNEYSFIKTANENHGIKVLQDLGDEAYYHSDGQNFYFVMVRKGDKTFNMKVNKITSNTSLEQFNQMAKIITSKL